MMDESGKFNEVAKKYILNGMRDYPHCFITIMAYYLIWTHAGELKILNLTTDDRLRNLHIIYKDHIDEWLEDYLRWYRNAVEEQGRKEVVLFTEVKSVSMSRCSHFAHSLVTNITHL